jgi:hypothetical protein
MTRPDNDMTSSGKRFFGWQILIWVEVVRGSPAEERKHERLFAKHVLK